MSAKDPGGWIMLILGLVLIGLAIWGYVYYTKLVPELKTSNVWIPLLSTIGIVVGLILGVLGVLRLAGIKHTLVSEPIRLRRPDMI